MGLGWHLKRWTLHQDTQREWRQVPRVHVALHGPISVLKADFSFWVGKKITFRCPEDRTVSHFKQRWPSGKKKKWGLWLKNCQFTSTGQILTAEVPFSKAFRPAEYLLSGQLAITVICIWYGAYTWSPDLFEIWNNNLPERLGLTRFSNNLAPIIRGYHEPHNFKTFPCHGMSVPTWWSLLKLEAVRALALLHPLLFHLFPAFWWSRVPGEAFWSTDSSEPGPPMQQTGSAR